MKILFAGSPWFAATCLEALIESGHHVAAVLTQADKKTGRGQKTSEVPVKLLANKHSIPLHQPEKFDDKTIEKLKQYKADIMVVFAYGKILPKKALDIPRLGCINIHTSLLPAWRGASPIIHSLLHGDKTSGISIIQMDEHMDTGDMLAQASCPISADDTQNTLTEKLTHLACPLLLKTLNHIDHIKPKKQNHDKASYSKKISKSDASIDWSKTSSEIECFIRAFNPWPVAFCHHKTTRLRIWQAKQKIASHQAKPGSIIHIDSKGLYIACGQGMLQCEVLQFEGKAKQDIASIYHNLPEWCKVDAVLESI
jgi:methionyl-tRNA formyltransferase